MKENYDFSDAIKNPYAKSLKEEGYSVLIHYGRSQSAMDAPEAAPGEENAALECPKRSNNK